MTALDHLDRELLDFLCACAHHRVRVIRVKAPRVASLRRLRSAGLVGLDDHLPSASALIAWIERQRTRSEAATARATAEEPPAPEAAEASGGGDAQCDAPPPDSNPELPDGPVAEGVEGFPLLPRPPVESSVDLDRLLTCFGDEFETLRVIAMRFGARSPQKIVRHARMLHEHGLVEQSPPTSGRPFLLWRSANSQPQNILGNIPEKEVARFPERLVTQLSKPAQEQVAKARRGYQRKPDAPVGDRRYAINRGTTEAPGTPREAPAAEESTSARRIEDHASTKEPALSACPPARARPVDSKVKARRDPTQPPETPLMDLRERQHANGMRRVAQVNRDVERKAAERLDAGERGRNSVECAKMAEIERRRADEFRLADPVEQAKTVIRIAGWNCFSAVIKGGPPDHFYVGNRIHTKAEMLAFAERLRTSRRLRA